MPALQYFPKLSNGISMLKTDFLISHEILESWPDAHLIAGQYCLVRPGRTMPGQMVAIYYDGSLFFNLLMYRDSSGNIAVKGSDGIVLRLKKGEYEIEGEIAFNRS